MIGLDASVLIAHLDPDYALHPSAMERLSGARGPAIWRELDHPRGGAYRPATSRAAPAAQAALKALAVTELPLPGNAAERLASLRAETRLKLPDCCVLLAAETTQGAVLTFDERLAREAEQRGLAA